MKTTTNFNTLPPLKRYKLIQQQQQAEEELANKDPITTSPICLPAKKRKHHSPDSTLTPSNYFSLPAKKRIWAPFDLNLDCQIDQSTSIVKSQDLPLKSQQTIEHTQDLPEKSQQPIEKSQHLREKSQEPIENVQEIAQNDEDGIVCAVCDSEDGDPSDPIVLCDGCDIMVHTLCYGYPFTKGIPKGDWFCDECLDSKKVEKVCCLCSYGGGALKETTDGKWAHLVCAIYVPEVFFTDPEERKGIDCSKVLKKRWENKCYVCESKSRGCVIDCSEPKCPLSFHVTCGLKEDLCIEYKQGKKGKGGVVAAFCSKHTDLWKKQEVTGKFKIVARDE